MASLSLGSIVIFLSALTLCYGTIEVLYELGVDEYKLPDLPYNYSGLEPYLDEKTLIVHHQGHHKAYTNKMNAALKEWRKEEPSSKLARSSIAEILRNLEDVPEKWRTSLKQNGGGYVNHIFYWTTMCPSPPPMHPSLKEFIQSNFKGGADELVQSFTNAAKSLFGSGYVWAVLDTSGNISIISTKDQDCPLSLDLFPILVLDVWEHAYYLKHQNRRPDYIQDWWGVVCWEEVEKLKLFWQSRNELNIDKHSEL